MLELFGHPFSSYTWKALIALYEKDVPFDFRVVEPEGGPNGEALRVLWPIGKFPVLLDDGRPVIESSIIIDYIDHRYTEAPDLVPDDPDHALDVRFMDRIFDNHVMGAMQAVVNEYLLDAANPDLARIAGARMALRSIYDWLEGHLPPDGWACGGQFTMADCAAAPALFYADWVEPIDNARQERLRAYRTRLLARPSVKRCVEDARPYRAWFPPGAPDRD